MLSVALWVLSSLSVSPAAPVADTAVAIQEWTVPWDKTRPRDPYVDGKGRVWFVGQAGDYLAFLVPETSEFKRFDLDPGSGPHNLIVDKQGNVWYAGNRAAHIGRLDPETGKIEKYPMPDPAARDPHTLVFDQRGDIWFSVQGGNFVGKLEVATGRIHLIQVPTPQARPYGIIIDSKDRPWFTEFGSNKIATVNPETMTIEEILLPRPEARPRRLDVVSDGSIWYTDYAKGHLGRIDPETRAVEEWPVPAGEEGRPYAIASDHHDCIWFVETGPEPNRFAGFDTRERKFIPPVAIESGAGSVRHMFFHRPSGEIWFGTDANTIGRAKLPSSGF